MIKPRGSEDDPKSEQEWDEEQALDAAYAARIRKFEAWVLSMRM